MEHFFAGQLQDLLPLVLTLLPSRDLLGVRLVCKAWCRKIDLLPDSFWNNLFVTEMFQSWITTNGYFTFPYEEFDLLQQAVPLILLNPAKVKLEALTPKQRVCYMQRKPLFTGRSTVLVDFKMEGTQGYFDAHWIFIRKPEGLEWAGPSLAMPIVLTTEEEAQMERVLFGLRHCFKAPFASSATVAVVCTDKESGAVLFEHKHTYGHFLDNLVAESAHYPFDPKNFLGNFAKVTDLGSTYNN